METPFNDETVYMATLAKVQQERDDALLKAEDAERRWNDQIGANATLVRELIKVKELLRVTMEVAVKMAEVIEIVATGNVDQVKVVQAYFEERGRGYFTNVAKEARKYLGDE